MYAATTASRPPTVINDQPGLRRYICVYVYQIFQLAASHSLACWLQLYVRTVRTIDDSVYSRDT